MFDPYHKWLGIPKDQRPPTYYQLLGISPQEKDPEAIEEAVIRQTAHVRTYQLGQHAEVCKRILGEISQARLTLLNEAKRKEYDQTLAEKTAAAAPPAPEEQFALDEPSEGLIRRPERKKAAKADKDESAPPRKKLKKEAVEEEEAKSFLGSKKVLIALSVGGGGGLLVLVLLAVLFFTGNNTTPPQPQPPLAQNPPPMEVVPPKENPPPKEVNPPKDNPPPKVDPPKIFPPPPPPSGEEDRWQLRIVVTGGLATANPRQVLLGGNEVVLYDLETRNVVRKFTGGSEGGVWAGFALAPDGKRFFEHHMELPLVSCWELDTGKLLGHLATHAGRVTNLVLTPDGRFLLSAANDKTVRLWDTATLKELHIFQGHANDVAGISVSPDGKYALSFSSREFILWDLGTRQSLKKIGTPFFGMGKVSFSPDGKKIIGSKIDSRELLVWDWDQQEPSVQTLPVPDKYWQFNFAPNGRHLITFGDSAKVNVFSWPELNLVRTFETGGKMRPNEVFFSADHRSLFVPYFNSLLRFPLPDGGPPIVATKPPQITPTPVEPPVVKESDLWRMPFGSAAGGAPTSNPQQVLLGGLAVVLYDLEARNERQRFTEVKSGGLRINFATSRDGKRFFASHMDQPDIYYWELGTGKLLGRLTGHTSPISGLALSPDEKFLVSSSVDKTVRLWDAVALKELHRFDSHSVFVETVSLTPDGKFALSNSRSELIIWDLDKRLPRKVIANPNMFHSLFSPDGNKVVASRIGFPELRIWDIDGQTPTIHALPIQDKVWRFRFTLSGRHLVTFGDSKKVTLFEWPELKPVCIYEPSRSNFILSVFFSLDRRSLFVPSGFGLYRFPLPEGGGPVVATKPPDPSPMPTPTKPPAEEKKRAEIPGEEAIKANQKLLQDQFKKEYAATKKNVAGRIALAEKLFKLGVETLDDLASRYVLLLEAKELATQAGQVSLALSVVEEIAKGYALSALDLRLQTMGALAKGTLTKDNPRELTDAALAVIPELIAANELPLAPQFWAIAEAVAKKYLPSALQKQVQKQGKDIQELVKDFEQMKAALAVLDKDPKNVEASGTVGKYLAFRKGDWDKGLDMLAQGGQGLLPDLARKDLAKPEEAKARVDLGHLWWSAADKESGFVQTAMQWRACYWYRQALPTLTGLQQGLVAERVKTVEERPAPFHTTDVVGEIGRLKGHTASITSLVMAADGKRLFSGSLDGTLRTWDLAKKGKSLGVMPAQLPVHSFAFSSDQRLLLVCSNATFKLLDARTGKLIPKLQRRDSLPGGGWVNASSIIVGSKNNLWTYNLETGSGSGMQMREPANHLILSPDNSKLAVMCGDSVSLYRFSDGFPFLFGNLNGEAMAAAFSADGKFLALGGKEKTIRVVNLNNRGDVKQLTGHTGPVQCLAFSPSGQRLLSGGSDKTVRLWDLASGKTLQTFALHTDAVTAVVFATDGRSAFSAGNDLTIRQWSLPREK